MKFFEKWLFKPKLKPEVYEFAAHQFDVGRVDKNAIKVLRDLDKCGYDAYLVGGVIRDLLLKIYPKILYLKRKRRNGETKWQMIQLK